MLVKIAFLVFALFGLLSCTVKSQIAEPSAPVRSDTQTNLRETVEKAFAEAAKGNPLAVYQLPKTVEIIKYLEPFSNSKDTNIRVVVIRFLDLLKSEAAIPLLVRAVADAESYNAERASEILYKSFDRQTLQSSADLRENLGKGVVGGNNSITAYALLGYFPTYASRKLLADKCQKASGQKAQLEYFERQKSLVACVVLSELGTENCNQWLEKFRSSYEQSAYFLLNNLALIKDPNTLETIFQNTIADDSPIDVVIIESGVPTPNPRFEPRFLDLAVNKFAERLKINFGFKLKEEARYGKSQIAAARRKILAEIAVLKNK